MSEEFLDCTDVVAVFEQMRREAMSQRVTTGRFRQPGGADRVLHRELQPGLVDVMPPLL